VGGAGTGGLYLGWWYVCDHHSPVPPFFYESLVGMTVKLGQPVEILTREQQLSPTSQ